MLDAQRAYQEAEDGPEKAEALARFIEAEEIHDDRMGLERAPKSFVARVVLPSVLLLVLVVSFALNLALSVTTHETSQETRNIAGSIQRLQSEGITAQRESCERQNDSRASQVKNLRSDVTTLRGQLEMWQAIVDANPAGVEQAPTEVAVKFAANLRKLEKGITRKQKAVHNALAAIDDVALSPGSPRADCALVVPVGPHAKP